MKNLAGCSKKPRMACDPPQHISIFIVDLTTQEPLSPGAVFCRCKCCEILALCGLSLSGEIG